MLPAGTSEGAPQAVGSSKPTNDMVSQILTVKDNQIQKHIRSPSKGSHALRVAFKGKRGRLCFLTPQYDRPARLQSWPCIQA